MIDDRSGKVKRDIAVVEGKGYNRLRSVKVEVHINKRKVFYGS